MYYSYVFFSFFVFANLNPDRPLQYHKKWVNGPSYRKWKLNVPILANCYRLAGQLMSDLLDRSVLYSCGPPILNS